MEKTVKHTLSIVIFEDSKIVFKSNFLVLSINTKKKTLTIVDTPDLIKYLEKDVEYSAVLKHETETMVGESNLVFTDVGYHANGDILISYEYQKYVTGEDTTNGETN